MALESLGKKGTVTCRQIHDAHIGLVFGSEEILPDVRSLIHGQGEGCFSAHRVLNMIIRIQAQDSELPVRAQRDCRAEAPFPLGGLVHRRKNLGIVVPDVQLRSFEIHHRSVLRRELFIEAQQYAGRGIGEGKLRVPGDYPSLRQRLIFGIDQLAAALSVGNIQTESRSPVRLFLLVRDEEGKT